MDHRGRMLWMLMLVHGAIAQLNIQLCLKCSNGEANCDNVVFCPDKTDNCYVRSLNGTVHRGCLQDLTVDADRQRCLNAADSSCLACADLVCNRFDWPKCHVCQEAGDETCQGEQSEAGVYCGQYSEESVCFERIVNGMVERGCRSDLGGDPCDGNEHCRTCEGSDCNKDAGREIQVTKCVQCRGGDSDDDGSCLSGVKAATTCPGPSDGRCYSRIVNGGIVERGCQGSLAADVVEQCNNTKCAICQGDGCNSGIFPVDRLTCNQCKSSNTSDCGLESTDESKSVVCKVYKENNRCFSRFGPDDHFERGCETDLGYHSNACDNVKDCMVCAGKNCNVIAAAQLEQLPKCQRCTSAHGEDCDEGSITPTICGDHLDDACFTKIEDGYLERNCLSTLSEADKAKCNNEDDASCHKCTGQGCNKQKWLKCHQCNSATDKACSEEQKDNLRSTYCRIQREDDECYTRIVDNVLERGCQSDLGKDVDACDSLEDNQCETCDDANCNAISKSKLMNDAGRLGGSLVLLVTGVMMAVVRF